MENLWKHKTQNDFFAKDENGRLMDRVGIDMFDDEQDGFVVIYTRYADGTRWPCRTVDMNADHAQEVLEAWAKKGYEGNKPDLHDYRKNRVPDLGGTPCQLTPSCKA